LLISRFQSAVDGDALMRLYPWSDQLPERAMKRIECFTVTLFLHWQTMQA